MHNLDVPCCPIEACQLQYTLWRRALSSVYRATSKNGEKAIKVKKDGEKMMKIREIGQKW